LRLNVPITQVIYQSDQTVFLGGKGGLNLLVPVVVPELDREPRFFREGNAGVGDIAFGPFVQWNPVMGPRGPFVVHRLDLDMILPLGEYNDRAAVNPGSNFFSFNPYWAGTVF